MKYYYLIYDVTFSPCVRLVDNKKWLNSENVTLVETIVASSFSEAIKQVEKNHNFNYSADLHYFIEK